MAKNSRKRVAIGSGVVAVAVISGATWLAWDPVLDWWSPDRKFLGYWRVAQSRGEALTDLHFVFETRDDGLTLRTFGDPEVGSESLRLIRAPPPGLGNVGVAGHFRVEDGSGEIELSYRFLDRDSLRLDVPGDDDRSWELVRVPSLPE